LFGFGNKKREFRTRVIALLPVVGIEEGDAGILHIYDLIDDWYQNGLNEYETALAFTFSKIENLAKRGDLSKSESLYVSAKKIQSEWVKSGVVTERLNIQFKSIAVSLNLGATVRDGR
jgi:hypothetical protein